MFIQMTGLSGAGKTTLARAVEERLLAKGYMVEIIDGDEYRAGLCSDLGFSKEFATLRVDGTSAGCRGGVYSCS